MNRQHIASITPLLLAAAILLGGNGLQGTLITLRASSEGFDVLLIGLMGSAYYLGFIVSSFYSIKLIQAVGHTRVFAALAAISAMGSLLMILYPEAWFWIVLRFFAGFSFAGLLTVIESWLNASSSNSDRGQVFSIYRIVDLVSVTGLQFLLPVFGTGGVELFLIVALLYCASLVPVSLSTRESPEPPKDIKFNITQIWAISPIACIGTFSLGLTNSSFRLIGPLYAQQVGLSISQVAIFMSAGILGGAIMQYPLGRLSDKRDRRFILLMVSAGASLAGLFLTFVALGHYELMYVGAFMFGSFAIPLYSISVAHANDHVEAGQYVLISAGLLFFFALGASIGPLIASSIMDHYGAVSFFIFISSVHGALILSVILRIYISPAAAKQTRSRFVSLIRTSPGIFRLAKKSANRKKKDSN